MKNQINIRFIAILSTSMIIAIWRIYLSNEGGANWYNFTPVGALALFGGTYFSSRVKSYLFPLLLLFVSDLVLMSTAAFTEYKEGLLYAGWYWTYGSFIIMVLIAEVFKKKVTILSVIVGGVLAAVSHYLISDFGVWLGGGIDFTTGQPYTKNWAGFISCYVAALPYLKNMILGNLFYGAILFGGFELAKSKISLLRVAS